MKMPPCRPLACAALAAVIGVLHSPGSTGQAQTAALAGNPLAATVSAMGEAEWRRVNDNVLADVWAPQALRPGGAELPERMVQAPGGFAWDSNRADLILYGGGHGYYSGNEVYRWRSQSLRWERASLPSEIARVPGGTAYLPIDGADAAPPAASPYGNNVFLPLADRFLTWGGAAFGSGGPYPKPVEGASDTVRPTGPYLFDPSRADGGKTGGTTGSHVQRGGPHPEIAGGNMWSNRDIHARLAQQQLPAGHTNGCAVSTQENGRDVVYLAAPEPTSGQLGLFRYELAFLEHPELDAMSLAGNHRVGASGRAACSYDPGKKVFVRTGDKTAPFVFWDLNTAGAANADRAVEIDPSIAAFSGWLAQNAVSISSCGMDFDALRERHVIWCGKGTLWALHSPAANVAHGWRIEALRSAGGVEPVAEAGSAILGKWKYIPQLDVYLGLAGGERGDIWVYKPEGWQAPADDGGAADSGLAASEGVQTLQATTLQAAEATTAQPITVSLQQGVNGYQGSTDVTLDSYHPVSNYGADASLKQYLTAYTALLRFAVFAREGGPVPDGSSIQSAKLHIYKHRYDYRYALHSMLKSWNESQATWQIRASGAAWTKPGANGAGADYASTADFTLTAGFDPGWMTFDVTARVKAYAAGGANHGWRLLGISGNNNLRYFNASEYPDATVRPKLVVTYAAPTTSSTPPPAPSTATQGPGLDQIKLPEAALAFYDPSITSSYWNLDAHLPWRRGAGDWYDAAGTLYGSQPYSTVLVQDLDKAQTVSADVTSLVTQWATRRYPNEGLMLRVASGGGSIHFSSREAASGRPTLRLTLSSGTTQTLTAAGDAPLDPTTISALGTRVSFEVAPGKPSVLFFRLPALQSGVTVTRATLTLTTPVQFSSARIGFYRVTRPLHQVDQPAQLGIAAAYPGDVGLEKDPNVLLVEDLRDTNFAARGWWKWGANPAPYGAIVSVADPVLGFTPLPGKKAVRVTWASNHNGAMDALWGFKQKVGYEPEEIYFRYYLMLANDWEPTTDGGKLPGFDGRYSGTVGNGGGGWSGTQGWSARGAFERGPPTGNPMHDYALLGNYVYHADQVGAFGSPVPWLLNGNGYLAKGRWYAIEQYFKVNSIDPATGKGRHDGILRTWVNGRLAYQRTNWRVRDIASIKIKNIWFNLYYGGTAFPPHTMHTYISQIVIAKKYIGPMAPR